MANVKITELTAATALAATDVLPIVDVGADATKKVSVSDLLRNLPDGTASAPALAFADDQNTGVLSPGNNSLAFATSGTQRLVIDSSGNVGINNTSPSSYLAGSRNLVIGAGASAAGLTVRSSTSTDGFFAFADGTTGNETYRGYIAYGHSTDSLRFATSATERLRIDSSGNVGIGLTSPGAPLAVASSGGINAKLVGRDNGTVDEAQLYFMHNDNSTVHGIIEGKSTSLNLYGGTTLAQTIDSSGRVGIGTSSPSTKLSVISNTSSLADHAIRVNGSPNTQSASSGLWITGNQSTSHYNWLIGSQFNVDGAFEITPSTAVDGATFSTPAVVVTSAGKVRINRTSNLFTEQFLVESDTTTVNPMTVSNTRSSAATDYAIIFGRNGSIVGSIQTSLSATSYITSSDHRLKENVVDISDGITRVKQLQPKRFNFIADADTAVDGFLAHEAQTVVPEAVTGTHNQVDDDNNPVYQGIDQSKLVPVLTAALQEAIAKIETLETKVAALEAQ